MLHPLQFSSHLAVKWSFAPCRWSMNGLCCSCSPSSSAGCPSFTETAHTEAPLVAMMLYVRSLLCHFPVGTKITLQSPARAVREPQPDSQMYPTHPFLFCSYRMPHRDVLSHSLSQRAPSRLGSTGGLNLFSFSIGIITLCLHNCTGRESPPPVFCRFAWAPEHPSLPSLPPSTTLQSWKDLAHRPHCKAPLHHHPNVLLSLHKA